MAQQKSISVNSLYQSKFLPIFEEAGTKIKLIILTAFLTNKSKSLLLISIITLIRNVEKKIPDLIDKEVYINGLYTTAQRWIKFYYDKPKLKYLETRRNVESIVQGKMPNLSTPAKLDSYISKNRAKLDMWAEAKGTPYITNYDKEIKERMKTLSQNAILTSESGKKSISLWQKAELDVRYEHQMKMLDDLRASNVEYCYISSHPNCSKRCEKWQGKLVSLNKPGDSNFIVGKLDNKTVYSLTDIMDQVDKYGYKNNIINGFNCRHRLIPYKGQHEPTEYTEEEVKDQRKVEERIRLYERKIRALKQQYELEVKKEQLTNVNGQSHLIKIQIEKLTKVYKEFCEKNGYAYEQYRINI